MGLILKRHRGLLGAAGLCLGWSVTGIAVDGAFSHAARADATGPDHRHMIATSSRRATEAGLAILREGGSAIDAAVAASMVLGVSRPDESGLGGGGLLLYFDAATRHVTVWDGRETAPAAATPDLFLDASGQRLDPAIAGLGGRGVGAPGLLRMLEAAHLKHGTLPWERLFAASIALAESGTPIAAALAAAIADETQLLARQPAARAAFLDADGRARRAGTVLVNKALAETLRAIAAGRADALLGGAVAADIATTVRTDTNPGLLTVDDLAAVATVERTPLCVPYRVHLVCSAGPPSAGGLTVLEAVGMLAHTGVSALRSSDPQPMSVAAAHLLAEVERLAQADAAFFLADPAFVRIPLPGLLAADYLAGRAALIDPSRAMPSVEHGDPSWDEPELRAAPPSQPQHGTSHLVVVDDAGNAVSLSATIQDPFGSGLVVRGFLLNNALTAFSPVPERDGRKVANRVEPGKRPLSAMAPTMVLDATGRLELVLGATGGDRIAAEVTQALIETLDLNHPPGATVVVPHVGARGDVVELEAGTPAAALGPGLQAMDHKTSTLPAPGGLALIKLTPSGPAGAADPRDDAGDSAGD